MPALRKTCRVCGEDYGRGEAFCPIDGGRLSSPSELDQQRNTDPVVGSIFDGRYHVLRMIGEGGMGIVYEAEHIKIDKRVAIKVLRDGFTRRPDVVARFQQEAKSASRIGHPHIIDVSDFGQTPSGASYIVMEMLQGEDLADLLAREYVLSPLRATGIVYQSCKALDAAHRLGIVHRDLKPENLFILEKDGQPDFVKIVDFGVAKMTDIELGGGGRRLTTTGMIFGTPEYMSPEQARGDLLDHRVDIYAMGVILYELVTGRVPFEGENFMEILNKHGQDAVPPLTTTNPATHVSPALQAVIMRALSKDQRARYQGMGEMAAALEACPEMPPRVPSESVLPPAWSIAAPPAPPAPPPGPPTAVADPVAPAAVAPAHERFATPMPVRASSPPSVLLGRTGLIAAAMAAGVLGALLVPRFSDPAPEAAAAARPAFDAVPAGRAVGGPAAEATPPLAPAAGGVNSPDPVGKVATTGSRGAAPTPGARGPAPVPDSRPVADAPLPAAVVLVPVDVVTRPAGARIRLAGKGQVCKRTPCTVELPRGVATRLVATQGRLRASAGVTAERAGTEVRMVLRDPSPAPETSRAAADDLKVPAMFR